MKLAAGLLGGIMSCSCFANVYLINNSTHDLNFEVSAYDNQSDYNHEKAYKGKIPWDVRANSPVRSENLSFAVWNHYLSNNNQTRLKINGTEYIVSRAEHCELLLNDTIKNGTVVGYHVTQSEQCKI